MTLDAIRYAEKVVSLDGGTEFFIPTDLYEWSDSGKLRTATSRLFSQSYAYDHLRDAVSPRDLARGQIRFGIGESSAALNDDMIDDMCAKLISLGPVWLYTLGADGTRRKARIRFLSTPDILVSYKRSRYALAVLDYERYTDWYGETYQLVSTSLSPVYPHTFTVTNPGTLPADELVIRFRANGNPGFTNPLLENLTNAYSFQSLRDSATADHEVKLDTATPFLGWSTNDGVSYVDDFANYVLPAAQVPLSFILDPGPNTIRYTNGDVNNGGMTIEIGFYAKFAR